mgnify:FL=1
MTEDNKMNQTMLAQDDEQLLQSFFADCQTELPDDGFSDRVMAALPSTEAEKAAVMRRRMEHVWTLVCVAIGLIAAVVCQGWEQIQGFLFSMKIDILMSGFRALTHAVDTLCHSQNLWMALAGCLVIALVWGYNKALDAKGI